MRIAGWVLGILVSLPALSLLVFAAFAGKGDEVGIAGLTLLVAGGIAFPPFWDRINKWREANGKSPISVGLFLIPAGFILIFFGFVYAVVQGGLTPETFDLRFNNHMAQYDTQLGVAVRSNLAGGKVTKGNNGNFFTIKDHSMFNQRMSFFAKMSTERILTEVFMVRAWADSGGSSAVAVSGFISGVALSGIMEAFDSAITEEERLEIVEFLINRVDFCNGETHEFVRSGIKYWSWCGLDLGTIHVGAEVVE